MGLLLGASVLTICEVLDLFCYNGIAKLVKRNEKKLTPSKNGPSADEKRGIGYLA